MGFRVQGSGTSTWRVRGLRDQVGGEAMSLQCPAPAPKTRLKALVLLGLHPAAFDKLQPHNLPKASLQLTSGWGILFFNSMGGGV